MSQELVIFLHYFLFHSLISSSLLASLARNRLLKQNQATNHSVGVTDQKGNVAL